VGRNGDGVVNAAFLFPGQGSQFVGMGKDLYDHFPAAKNLFDRAAQVMTEIDVRKVCFEGPADKLTQTRYSQPAIFVASMAAYEVFKTFPKSKNFKPLFTAGLSLGEATALCAGEAISFDEGLRFVRARGQYMDEAALERPGLMAAVLNLDLPIVEKIC
jgi:[acyl-carrier-protein] S-malonyltransferase